MTRAQYAKANKTPRRRRAHGQRKRAEIAQRQVEKAEESNSRAIRLLEKKLHPWRCQTPELRGLGEEHGSGKPQAKADD